MAVGQLLFYATALAGLALRRVPLGSLKVIYVPFFYCMANRRGRGRLDSIAAGPPHRALAAPAQRCRHEGRMTPAATRTPAAVVIGLDSITGLQTVRILARRGIRVVGLARNSRHPGCRTNACMRIVFTETAGDELAERLLQLAPSFEEAPVLFPCTDLSVLAISQHRDALASAYRSVLPARGVIERLLDKAQFQAYASDAGLPVAQTRILHNRADAADAADTLRFPCVLKPAVKTSRWHAHTSAKVFRVATPS